MRSLLFVPADRPERFTKAAATGADVLILDLEDSVAIERKMFAREAVAKALNHTALGPKLFVRINPLGSQHIAIDLAILSGLRLDGIMLPKAEGAASVNALSKLLATAKITAPILPIATETPRAIFQLGSYQDVASALAGLTWGAEDLPAAIGAATSREPDGRYTPPYELARSLALMAAHAAGVEAIETVYPDFRDLDGLSAYTARAARDGFTGMMAVHPSQISVINAAFTPNETVLAHAQEIIDAFAANPGVGTLQVNGRMVDAPHLKQAQKLLARAASRVFVP